MHSIFSMFPLAFAFGITAAQNASAPTSAQNSSVLVAPGTIALGGICSTSDESPCMYGASCYGLTADTITTCGSFQAACSNNAQCATNTCEKGLCNGVMPTSQAPASKPTATSISLTLGTVNSNPGNQSAAATTTSPSSSVLYGNSTTALGKPPLTVYTTSIVSLAETTTNSVATSATVSPTAGLRGSDGEKIRSTVSISCTVALAAILFSL